MHLPLKFKLNQGHRSSIRFDSVPEKRICAAKTLQMDILSADSPRNLQQYVGDHAKKGAGNSLRPKTFQQEQDTSIIPAMNQQFAFGGRFSARFKRFQKTKVGCNVFPVPMTCAPQKCVHALPALLYTSPGRVVLKTSAWASSDRLVIQA